MEEKERIEIGELGRETLNEWYTEREIEREAPKVVEEKPLTKATSVKAEEVSPIEEEKSRVKAKVKELLILGESKGLSYAIEQAKKSRDPLLLDLLHDVLAEDGNYKKILKR